MGVQTLKKDDVFEVQGRRFRPTAPEDVTFEQHTYAANAVEEAGLGTELMEQMSGMIDGAIKEGEPLGEEVAMEMSRQIMMRAFKGRAYLDVLAGLLTEVDVLWTYESALANREFFAGLRGDDIPKIHAVMVQAVLGFFLKGLGSMTTSPKYSTRPRRPQPAAVGAMGANPALTSDPAPEHGSGSSDT